MIKMGQSVWVSEEKDVWMTVLQLEHLEPLHTTSSPPPHPHHTPTPTTPTSHHIIPTSPPQPQPHITSVPPPHHIPPTHRDRMGSVSSTFSLNVFDGS